MHADEPQDDYPLPDADLDLFMNREFIDFDTGLSTNFKADSPTAPKSGEAVSSATTAVPDFGGLDFMSTGRFNSTAQFASAFFPARCSCALVYFPVPGIWSGLCFAAASITAVQCAAALRKRRDADASNAERAGADDNRKSIAYNRQLLCCALQSWCMRRAKATRQVSKSLQFSPVLSKAGARQ